MFNTNYSMPTDLESIVSKQSDVEKSLKALNAALDDKKSVQEVNGLETTVKNDLKALNAAIAEQWIKEQQDAAQKGSINDAVKLYLDNSGRIAGFKLYAPKKDSEHYEIKSVNRALSFSKFNKAVECASSTAWYTMVQRLLINTTASHVKDLEANTGKMNLQQPKTWQGTSVYKMQEQLEMVVEAMLPAGFKTFHMRKADVNYLIKATQSKVTAGNDATWYGIEEQKFIAHIVTAINFAMNGKKYNSESKAEAVNPDKGVKSVEEAK